MPSLTATAFLLSCWYLHQILCQVCQPCFGGFSSQYPDSCTSLGHYLRAGVKPVQIADDQAGELLRIKPDSSRDSGMNKTLQTALLGMLLLTGCSTVSVDNYRDNEPAFIPGEFFQGRLTAHGVVMNRGGEVTRHFNAEIHASWQDGIGTLDEDFIFDDGEKQKRVWTLTPDGQGGYTGTAGDVIGEGRLSYAGNAVFLDYVLRIPYGDGTIDLRVDDRMYLVEENVLINESKLSKYGFDVGRILLTIVRHPVQG
jgi:hypothetical protein